MKLYEAIHETAITTISVCVTKWYVQNLCFGSDILCWP